MPVTTPLPGLDRTQKTSLAPLRGRRFLLSGSICWSCLGFFASLNSMPLSVETRGFCSSVFSGDISQLSRVPRDPAWARVQRKRSPLPLGTAALLPCHKCIGCGLGSFTARAGGNGARSQPGRCGGALGCAPAVGWQNLAWDMGLLLSWGAVGSPTAAQRSNVALSFCW